MNEKAVPTVFEISVEDITNAERGNPNKCALVFALKRANPLYGKVVVSVTERKVWIDGYEGDLGGDILEWLKRFDAGEKVEPMKVHVSPVFPGARNATAGFPAPARQSMPTTVR